MKEFKSYPERKTAKDLLVAYYNRVVEEILNDVESGVYFAEDLQPTLGRLIDLITLKSKGEINAF